MILLRKGYDSEVDVIRCDLCGDEIGWKETKIIFGTGSSYATVYHEGCWQDMVGEKQTLPGAREHTGEGLASH